MLVAWNSLELCGGVFEKQIGATAVLSGVEQLKFAPICLLAAVHVAHGCQNLNDVVDVGVAFSCDHCMAGIIAKIAGFMAFARNTC